MSRRFNFMPSRYVTDPSRHVTPSHGDLSRTQRDAGVTEGGQPADTSVTHTGVTHYSDVVPRDKQGTTPGQVRDVVRTPCGQDADVERRLFGLPTPTERARLAGRHGETWYEFIRSLLPDVYPVFPGGATNISDEKLAPLHAAYYEGRALRAQNVRCFCQRCMDPPQIVEKERKRIAYAARRRQELLEAGVAEAEADKRILEEIDRGLAL